MPHGWSRREVLNGLGGCSVVGLAGCSENSPDSDDYDPELAEIIVENLDETLHTVTIEVSQGGNADELVVNRTREMGASTEWRISDFPGRGTEFTIQVRVDDGEQNEFQLTITDCTRFRVDVRDAETVDMSDELKTICYQQSG